MYSDRFEKGVARLRHRFAATLESKIRTTVVSADHLARGDDGVFKRVSESYRHLHGIYGIGTTVGFPATSEAAREAEASLLQAYHEGRGLSEGEVRGLKRALVNLQAAAAAELRTMYRRGA